MSDINSKDGIFRIFLNKFVKNPTLDSWRISLYFHALPYCFKTPQHSGSDTRTIINKPVTMPPMEPPQSEAA